MEQVSILSSYKCGSLVLHKVKPSNLIEYGTKNHFHCFEYESLAAQWEVSKATLDTVKSFDLLFNQQMYEHRQETEAGLVKTQLFNADITPALFKRLMDSAAATETKVDSEEQMFLLATIIRGAKFEELKYNAKS